jgi:hypothetical protein
LAEYCAAAYIHSFRRWFCTKAKQAGQAETIIAAVVGYKLHGMTFGVYSGGPSEKQFGACVEAVKLPDALSFPYQQTPHFEITPKAGKRIKMPQGLLHEY